MIIMFVWDFFFVLFGNGFALHNVQLELTNSDLMYRAAWCMRAPVNLLLFVYSCQL